jgi:hypothetical protein
MKFFATLPNGSEITWKSTVAYNWAAAALNSEGGSYLISSHVKQESATSAARAFTNREKKDGWHGVVVKVSRVNEGLC